MLKTTGLILGTLSICNNGSSPLISNDINLSKVKQNINELKQQYRQNHIINNVDLKKDFSLLEQYSQHKIKHFQSGGIDNWKWKWYGAQVWVSEGTGSQVQGIIDNLKDGIINFNEAKEEITAILALIPGVPGGAIFLGLAAVLIAQWAVIWSNTDEGDGIRFKLTWALVVVWAHAQ